MAQRKPTSSAKKTTKKKVTKKVASKAEPKKTNTSETDQELVTNITMQVLQSLGLVGKDGVNRNHLYGPDWKPHVASKFGTYDNGRSVDHFLQDSSSLTTPIGDQWKAPGVGMPGSPGVNVGPPDIEKVRTAASQTPGFAGLSSSLGFGRGLKPYENSYGTLGFTEHRINPYMTNYAYGANMYGEMPVYFMMMQEQNGGLLYWPVNYREKVSWIRYMHRCVSISRQRAYVKMADGTVKEIQEIIEGDKVVTALGNIKPVKETFKKTTDVSLYTIKANHLQDGLEVTHHHPFYVIRKEEVFDKYKKKIKGKTEFKKEWVFAQDLKEGDYVLVKEAENKNSSSEITPELARILGYYTAEGVISEQLICKSTENSKGYKWGEEKVKKPRGIVLSIHKNEIETLYKDIERCCKTLNINCGVQRIRENVAEIFITGEWIGNLCLKHCRRHSKKKQLSPELMNNSEEVILNFLGAYIAGDGHLCKKKGMIGKIDVATASLQLANQVQSLCRKVDSNAKIFKQTRVGNHPDPEKRTTDDISDIYHVRIPKYFSKKFASAANFEFEDSIFEQKVDKQVGWLKTEDGYLGFKIKSVEKTFEGEDTVYNLAVEGDGDDNSFVCNGMIVHNTDPYVGAAVDLSCDLPMSRLGIKMPKLKSPQTKRKAKKIKEYYEKWNKKVKLFKKLQNIIFEYTLLGNVYAFCEKDEANKQWSRLVILPPEDMQVVDVPFADFAYAAYYPEMLVKMVTSVYSPVTTGENQIINFDENAMNTLSPIDQEVVKRIPKDMIESILQFGTIVMDTNPMTGSFCEFIAHKRTEYSDRGVSKVERALISLLQKEHCKYTQLSLMSRLMTPRYKISAPGIPGDALEWLRSEVDASMQDPDYHLMANFDFEFTMIDAQSRLIQLQPEYERIENEVITALGIPKDILSGEGSFSGSARLSTQILNERFMLLRDVLKEFVEENLYKPMAIWNDFYEEDPDTGEKVYIYPELSFNRLTIQDNQEVFEALFRMYEKGSLPVQVLYDLFNLNPDEMSDLLVDDMFTARDANFNALVAGVHESLASAVAEKTDIVDKIISYMGLHRVDDASKPIIEKPQDLGEGLFEKPEAPTMLPGMEESPNEEAMVSEGMPGGGEAGVTEGETTEEETTTEEAPPEGEEAVEEAAPEETPPEEPEE